MTDTLYTTTAENWLALLARLELEDASGTYDALVGAYTARSRHYHSLVHIADCLEQLSEHLALAEQPDEIALALWFHDAIYNWRSSTNEADSADWALRFLSGQNADASLGERIAALIMATCHGAGDAGGLAGDAALIVDIDLSILGRDHETYDRFEANIRKEYRWVPLPVYRTKRREVLHWFLDRERIFLTDVFEDKFGAVARENLERAIAGLA